MNQPQYQRTPRPLPEKPRRVRGGIRLASGDWPPPLNWAATRWLEFVRRITAEDVFTRGLEYGQAGQTRRLDIQAGSARASVQGRAARAYQVDLKMDVFSDEQWDRIIKVMIDQALFAAKLLAGEAPDNIEEVMVAADSRLFPTDLSEVTASCTCEDPEDLCKHIACVGLLLTEQMQRDPFVIFALRGMPGDEFLERLRQRRAVASAEGGRALAYVNQSVPEPVLPALEEVVDRFWLAGGELERLETRLQRPPVSKALLRRLGPSPFDGKFPLVGLLATCYETISETILQRGETAEDVEDEIS